MTNVFFLHQIKHSNGSWDKGIVVKSDPEKNNLEEARQGYHAYLGAYAYGHDPNTDYVQCKISNLSGAVILEESWEKFIPDSPETEEE